MQITVRLYAALGRYRPPDVPPTGAFPWDVADGVTAAEVAAALGIPAGMLRVCAVNGQTVEKAHPLAPGDHLALVPASAGGAIALPVPTRAESSGELGPRTPERWPRRPFEKR